MRFTSQWQTVLRLILFISTPDIDECMEFTFNCDPSQKCENTPGSYKCVCDEGLYWIDNMCKGDLLHN